jgi:hypothetical protein
MRNILGKVWLVFLCQIFLVNHLFFGQKGYLCSLKAFFIVDKNNKLYQPSDNFTLFLPAFADANLGQRFIR